MRPALLAVLFAAACAPTAEDRAEDARRWEERRQLVEATPKRWAECRSVCGDAAALLPVGDGSHAVVCSCVNPCATRPGP